MSETVCISCDMERHMMLITSVAQSPLRLSIYIDTADHRNYDCDMPAGRPREFSHQFQVRLTDEQLARLDELVVALLHAGRAGATRSTAVRTLIDAGLEAVDRILADRAAAAPEPEPPRKAA
jgi:predicted DNA-binding protein